jgi:topoisomerase-4 subunit B
VNGLRTGLLEAMRDFCELRSLLPRGVKLTPDDIWERCSLCAVGPSSKIRSSPARPRSACSREAAAFVAGVAKDAFSLWLNQHTGRRGARRAVHQQRPAPAAQRQEGGAQEGQRRARSAGQARGLSGEDPERSELFLVEGDSAGGSPSRPATASSRPSCRCAARS